jgi:hypothetical protein
MTTIKFHYKYWNFNFLIPKHRDKIPI